MFPTSESTFERGPEYTSRYKEPTIIGSETESASSRTTGRPEQVRNPELVRSLSSQKSFKTYVIGRDGVCLLTKTDPNACVAAHIVPQSRPDVSVLPACRIAHHSSSFLTTVFDGPSIDSICRYTGAFLKTIIRTDSLLMQASFSPITYTGRMIALSGLFTAKQVMILCDPLDMLVELIA